MINRRPSIVLLLKNIIIALIDDLDSDNDDDCDNHVRKNDEKQKKTVRL